MMTTPFSVWSAKRLAIGMGTIYILVLIVTIATNARLAGLVLATKVVDINGARGGLPIHNEWSPQE
jgi:hypothetical protein